VKVQLEQLNIEIDIDEITGRRRGYRGGRGFYWQDSRMPPIGAFRTPGDALRDIAAKLDSGELAAMIEAARENFRARRAVREAAEG